MKKLIALGALCVCAFGQISTGVYPPGGSSGGVGAANAAATCASAGTTCAVDITSLNLTTIDPAQVTCISGTGSARTFLAWTTFDIAGSAPITTVTPHFTNTANVTCTVNSNGGAGATGLTGPVGATGPPGGQIAKGSITTSGSPATATFTHNFGLAAGEWATYTYNCSASGTGATIGIFDITPIDGNSVTVKTSNPATIYCVLMASGAGSGGGSTIPSTTNFISGNGAGNGADSGKAVPSGAVVGTTDAQTLTNKTLTSPVVNTPTGIVKGDVGLGSVDNTSDATKNAASVTLTNKTLTTPTIGSFANSTHNHSNSAGGGQLGVSAVSATGTPGSTTFWRGDNTWAVPAGSGGGANVFKGSVTTSGSPPTATITHNLGLTDKRDFIPACWDTTTLLGTGNVTGIDGNSATVTTASAVTIYCVLLAAGGTATSFNQQILSDSSTLTQRNKFKLAAGTNITLTPTDNGTDQTTITIASAGGGSGASSVPQLTDIQVTRTTSTALAVAIGNVAVSGVSYSIAPGTIGISAGTGTVRVAVDTSVTPPVGKVYFSAGLTATCSGMGGCTTPVAGSAFGSDDIQIATWTVTSGTFDVSGLSDLRGVASKARVVAGTGMSSSVSGHTQTVGVNTAVIPIFTLIPGTGTALTSASSITPTSRTHHVTGTAAVATIVATSMIDGEVLTLVPDAAFTTTTGGNIGKASTGVVGQAMRLVWDATATKWYPTY